ncbi:MAG: hypothetical protein AAF481_05935 [Acidobacteriota bacterium]
MNDALNLTQYLLGELPEDERNRLEERLLAEPKLFEQAVIAEGELHDAYAAGELTPEQRHAFENRLLRSSEQQDRQEFARLLRQVAGETGGDRATAPPPPARVIGGARRFGGFERVFAPLAAAAAVALLIAGSVFFQRSQVLEDRLAQVEDERTAWVDEREALLSREAGSRSDLAGERAAAQEAQEALRKELERTQGQVRELESQLAKRRTRPPRRASFVLAAALRSSVGPRELALPADAEDIELTLETGAFEDFSSYVAVMFGPDGAERWSRAGIEGATGDGGTTVTLDIPADLFSAGSHEVLLHGRSQGAEAELVGNFEFRIVNP